LIGEPHVLWSWPPVGAQRASSTASRPRLVRSLSGLWHLARYACCLLTPTLPSRTLPHLQIADLRRDMNKRLDDVDGRLKNIEVRCAGFGCWRQACQVCSQQCTGDAVMMCVVAAGLVASCSMALWPPCPASFVPGQLHASPQMRMHVWALCKWACLATPWCHCCARAHLAALLTCLPSQLLRPCPLAGNPAADHLEGAARHQGRCAVCGSSDCVGCAFVMVMRGGV